MKSPANGLNNSFAEKENAEPAAATTREMEMLEELAQPEFILPTALLMAPSYLANGLAPLFSGGGPLDRGRMFLDGRRLLGDGKTRRGTAGALAAGVSGAFIIVLFVNTFLAEYALGWTHAAFGSAAAGGAVTGDLFGAFLKRRLGLPRGAKAPPLDQLGFIVFSLLFAYTFSLNVPRVTLNATMVVFVLIVTPFLHLLGNYVGYKTGWKKEPW